MDLTSAENSAKRLLTYMQSLATSNTKLYSKSKDKIKKIADISIQITKLSADILETEILNGEVDEFDCPNNVSPELMISINEILNQAKRLQSFIPDGCKESNDKSTHEELKIPDDKVRQIVYHYKDTFELLSKLSPDNKCVKCCIDLINKWIIGRLFTRYDNAPPFHYNVYRIKNIIYSIILCYGNAVADNSVDSFIAEFDEWLERLSVSPDSNTWIAPYSIYSIERKISSNNLEPPDVNLTSILIYDILWDLGLNQIAKGEDVYNVFLDAYTLWNLVSNTDSHKLDNYRHYNSDVSILLDYNIV